MDIRGDKSIPPHPQIEDRKMKTNNKTITAAFVILAFMGYAHARSGSSIETLDSCEGAQSKVAQINAIKVLGHCTAVYAKIG
jgi:hypothetical protein